MAVGGSTGALPHNPIAPSSATALAAGVRNSSGADRVFSAPHTLDSAGAENQCSGHASASAAAVADAWRAGLMARASEEDAASAAASPSATGSALDSRNPPEKPFDDGCLDILGPPLKFLPKEIEPQALQAFRADYQAFRTGCAAGARGEIGQLCHPQTVLEEQWKGLWRRPYEQLGAPSEGRARRVTLIGLKLASTSAAMSAASAACKHHEDIEMQKATFSSGRLPPYVSSPAHSEAAAPVRQDVQQVPPQGSSLRRVASKASCATSVSLGPGLEEEAGSLKKPLIVPTTTTALYGRQITPFGVAAQQGVGMLFHIAGSFVCLLPGIMMPSLGAWQCLGLPGAYVALVVARLFWDSQGAAASANAKAGRFPCRHRLGRVLRMERVVRDSCVPSWFTLLSGACYVLIALSLALSRSYDIGKDVESGRSVRISLWGPSLQRHDYSCWGIDAEDVADCVLVRHSACTVLVTFYMCLLAASACNRDVKGAGIVVRHRQSLLSLFPNEATSLFTYIERTVEGNEVCWRMSRRYKVQAAATALAWTLLSYAVYAGLLVDSKSDLARAAFIAAAPCTYTLQFTLLRHVLLRVLLYLEAIKARAAALAYCDEEEVLPFSSAHAIYVWFSVRRNVQAQNEMAYQHAKPILVASLAVAAACSCWVASELSHRGLSVFALTNRGGGSLMAVASAGVSCCFVGVFLGTLLEIGKLEEEHSRQLRMAQCRLEHHRWRCDSTGAPKLSREEQGEEEGASAMIEKVLVVLETHDQRPSIFGVEIGSKSFRVVYAALLSNGWYLLVWGVLIPLISSPDES